MGIFDKVKDIFDGDDEEVVTTDENQSDMYSAEKNAIDGTTITPEDVQRDFERGTEPPDDEPVVGAGAADRLEEDAGEDKTDRR